MKPLKLYAIVDIQKPEPRYCYADENKTDGLMALYDKKPTIPKAWKKFKKVRQVLITNNQ